MHFFWITIKHFEFPSDRLLFVLVSKLNYIGTMIFCIGSHVMRLANNC